MTAVAISEPVRPGETYTKSQFLQRTEMGEHAYRTAVRKGLRVVHTAGKAFVRADDWRDYLLTLAENAVPA